MAGKKMQPFMVRYTTSERAVTGRTRAFAAELGKRGIRVNSVHPEAWSPRSAPTCLDRGFDG